ncbi:FAD-dependent oxidoreductase [Streptomyces sp. ACA25]|uniref:FAD-dependent oxidoreductase n=1 Tax=Streptomyces sp. ACA25 TaxID=3022596 RepID=UPI0023074349|nr:FAD-dependent oxidoreductase [Streptomyces sp. ACA25]MDB1089771.1 FAD-dependent oxidoreductase [Streptomyces sp. ACA25]
MTDVIVIGGGVIGLTTAVVLAEAGARVRVWSRDLPGDTTSALAGGLCWPYRIAPADRALGWALRSLRTFRALAENREETGVRMVAGTMRPGGVPAAWATAVDARPAGPDTIRARVPLIDMPVYLHHLLRRLSAAGGSFEQRGLSALTEAAGVPVVVNCTGLGSRELVHDPAVRPVRGQLVVTENPGVEEWYVAAGAGASDTTYVLPQPYGAVLGGTAEDGVDSLTPDPAVAEAVVRRCARVHPALAGARVLAHRVGLRPFRPSVRLAAELLPDGTRCVHNYGHGGAGVTVSWGCAVDGLRAAEL